MSSFLLTLVEVKKGGKKKRGKRQSGGGQNFCRKEETLNTQHMKKQSSEKTKTDLTKNKKQI